MIAADASVSSRRWTDGQQDVVQLLFPDGLSLRPIVKQGQPLHHTRKSSTVVRVKLREDSRISDVEAVPLPSGLGGVKDFQVPLGNLIASWIAGLDVSVTFVDPSGRSIRVHQSGPGQMPTPNALLRQLSMCEFREGHRSAIELNIEALSGRMRPVGELRYGFAAIQDSRVPGVSWSGVRSVGGMSQFAQHGDAGFVGYINCEPESARRGSGHFSASKELIDAWAAEQVALFEATSPSDHQRVIFGSSLCAFGVDPIDVIRVYVLTPEGGRFCSMTELAEAAKFTPILLAESIHSAHVEAYAEPSPIPGMMVVKLWTHGLFSSLEREDQTPKERNSILGCLLRTIEHVGMRMALTQTNIVFRSPFGDAKALAVSAKAR